MQQRAATAEGLLERERGLHRRELRRRAKELADMQEDLVQVILPLSAEAYCFLIYSQLYASSIHSGSETDAHSSHLAQSCTFHWTT